MTTRSTESDFEATTIERLKLLSGEVAICEAKGMIGA
jgi:hypothetical protein